MARCPLGTVDHVTDAGARTSWLSRPSGMNGFSSGGRRPDGPLAGIKDDSGPILTIASITIDPAAMKGGDLKNATSQIAIELYAPLPGGLAAGGRFAPSTVRVPGLVEVPSARPPTKDRD